MAKFWRDKPSRPGECPSSYLPAQRAATARLALLKEDVVELSSGALYHSFLQRYKARG